MKVQVCLYFVFVTTLCSVAQVAGTYMEDPEGATLDVRLCIPDGLEDTVQMMARAKPEIGPEFQTFVAQLQAGDTDACYQLGLGYQSGRLIFHANPELGEKHEIPLRKNLTRAFECFSAAAREGHEAALNRLGVCYFTGQGVAQNRGQAFICFKEAADKGLDLAQHNLANMYYDGVAVELDHDQAFVWFHKAAAQGYAEATNNLGLCYIRGHGTAQDRGAAIKCFQEAAAHGNYSAKLNLATCYQDLEKVKT